jgi:predicted LPLAT superfamily acyltransferase
VISRSQQAWADRPEGGSAIAVRAGVRLALGLGRSVARLLLPAATLYFLAGSAADRTASRTFLRRVLGREPGFSEVFRHFHTFALTLLDRVYVLSGSVGDFDVRVKGEDIVAGLLARGEGCLLMGSHLGSFEIIGAVGRRAGVPRVRPVMFRRNAGPWSAAIAAIDPELAGRVIALGEPDSMLELEGALSKGEFAGMLADRVLNAEDAVSLPFLGTPARFPRGPFQVAAVLKRPVILMIGLYQGGNRYDVFFERLADMSEAGRSERDAVVDKAMRRYVERLEHYCRLAPFNWFNFYDYWS